MDDDAAGGRRRVAAWVGGAAVAAGAVTVTVSTVVSPGPGDPVGEIDAAPAVQPRRPGLAVYRGSAVVAPDRIDAYEAFLGRPVPFVVEFLAPDSWANLTWPEWQAEPWRRAGRTVVLGGSLSPPDDLPGGRDAWWALAAAGGVDDRWRELGERLVATGQANAVLRGAHEFNGHWFAHRVEPDEVGDFVVAWRRWVEVLRAVPGARFTFDWNPAVGVDQLAEPELAYPGDAWVDRVALDVYDGPYPGWRPGIDPPPDAAARDAVWAELLDGPRGLRFWRTFAASRGKPLSFPEWGLRVWAEPDGRVIGGGDNPTFVRRMAEIITDPAWNVAYHAFWEDPAGGGRGVADPDAGRPVPVPASRRAFVEAFGG